MRQVQTARKANRYAGFSVYSYTSLFVSDSQVHRAEQQNLQRLLGYAGAHKYLTYASWILSAVSALIALALGIASATLGRKVDAAVSWCIDLVMGIPHILLVMLISIACGRGFTGVVAGVALSHWTGLARVIRGEVIQLRQAPYILAAQKLGVSKGRIVRNHLLPHLLPQFLTGLILLFPHAILHEASVTFLGFGLPSEQPAIGVILSESMQYLTTGRWWLALFPGLMLILAVMLFAVSGERLRRLLDPASVHE